MIPKYITIFDQLQRARGFNDMNPQRIADELYEIQASFDSVFWTPDKDDTVLVFFTGGSPFADGVLTHVRNIELAAWRCSADEIDVMETDEALRLLTLRTPLTASDQALFDEMAKDHPYVYRLWWD